MINHFIVDTHSKMYSIANGRFVPLVRPLAWPHLFPSLFPDTKLIEAKFNHLVHLLEAGQAYSSSICQWLHPACALYEMCILEDTDLSSVSQLNLSSKKSQWLLLYHKFDIRSMRERIHWMHSWLLKWLPR